MIFALVIVMLTSVVLSYAAVRLFPKLPFKWKLVIYLVPLVAGCGSLIGLYYYGAYWSPPDAVIIKPTDVYPGRN